MASPLQAGKQSVDLKAPAVRVSRIRRDPPPVVKEVDPADLEEREAWAVVIGVISFALALAVIIVGLGGVGGWSPSEYNVHLEL